MITIGSKEALLTYVDEAMREERLGEMWYNLDVDRALGDDAGETVVETLERIRDEEFEHFETFLEIESRVAGTAPPEGEVATEAEENLDDMETHPSLREALEEKRDAEDQGEDLYLEIADAVRRSDLDVDTDSIADTFERIAAEEADHRDSLAELLDSGAV